MILAAHVTEAPKPITEYRETIPPALAELVMRCLEKHPADRWQTTEEVLAKLEAMATPGGGVTPTGVAQVTAQLAGSRRVQVAVAVGVAAMAAMAVAASLVWLSRGEGERELDPNLVAVVPFRAGGVDPNLQYLREGIVDLLFARLTGEGGPRALAPQTAISAWQRAGGSEDADLPEERALELAADLGAAQLIQGGIVGSASRMTLNATLLDVPDGNVRARATVEGPADSLPGLIDRLTGQLLALRAGAEARSLAELTSTSLPALKAYLDGQAEFRRGRYVEALRHFDRALQEDSTFALAGLWHSIDATWGTGRSLVPGRDVAWAHRDRLGPRDRMLLDAWVGSSFPDPEPRAQYIADGERAVALIPDRWEVWFLFGDAMYHNGPLVGMSNPLERAMGAFERALELNPDFGPILSHMFDHAAITGDTSRVRETRDRYRAGVGAMSVRQEWLAAGLLGDSLALGAWRSSLDTLPWRQVFGAGIVAQHAGAGLADAELASKKALERARTRNENWLSLNRLTTLMLNTGRPRAAREFAERAREFEPDNGLHSHLWNQIDRALFWGADTSLAIDAAKRLQAFADEPLSADAHVRRRQIGDHCALGMWHAATGNSGAARQSLTFLGGSPDDEPPVDRRAYRRTCVATLHALLASPGERRAAIDRLDSLLRTGPATNWVALRRMNLTAASLWSAEGDVERALAAVRRRDYALAINYASTFYREEGRLAALAGDKAGAIDAYQRYLALRVNPEPAVQEEINQVRRELAKLVGEPAQR